MDKKNEYIEINFMSFFILLYKNFKTLILSFILLLTLAGGFLYYKGSKETGIVLKQMIQVPSYFDGSQNLHPIIDYDRINVILQNILEEIKQSAYEDKMLKNIRLLYPMVKYNIDIQRQVRTINGQNSIENKKIVKDANYKLKQKYDRQRLYFTLLAQTKLSDVKQMSQLYQDIMRKFSESKLISNQVQLWKNSIEVNIKESSEMIAEYKELLKQDEVYLKELMSEKSKGDVIEAQAMKIKYITIVDGLKKQIFSLKQSIDKNKLKLSSSNSEVLSFGGIIQQPVVYVVAKKLILASLLLVIIGSLTITLFVAFFKKVANEAKKPGN
ncbi:hypothetical protein E4K63_01550 [Allofrancisella inopinata]|uniref:Polysaccharide chain length determinant N-terminal domain-containing protein n=2 Tax=Allofrancisella inopinata TaxID=1085647 RepID=A0AAE6YHD5_9GAMM|nr:hypothetical protein E4K63_01550 [Allofrancisella inopinata]